MSNANISEHAQGANTEQKKLMEEMSAEEIIDHMMEKVCDEICKYPCTMNQEELDAKCTECPITEHVMALINREERTNGMV